MRLPLALASLLTALAAGACADDEPSPVEQCQADADNACCQDSECGADELCDHDFICSPAPGGGVQCSDATGDRSCHALCTQTELDMPCPGGGKCTMLTRFQGGDHGLAAYACF